MSAAEGHGPTTTEYIQHHLQNLAYGKLPEGYVREGGEILETATWTFAHTAKEAKDMGFMAIHVDSMAWSIGLAILFSFLFRIAAKKAHTGVPSAQSKVPSRHSPQWDIPPGKVLELLFGRQPAASRRGSGVHVDGLN